MQARIFLTSSLLALGTVVGACSSEPTEEVDSGIDVGDSESEPTSTSTADASSSSLTPPSFDGTDGTDDTAGASEDPDYPRPNPLDGGGECPEGFWGPITFDMNGWVCIPACTMDDPPMCPSGLSGDAVGRCATNPLSSAAPCSEQEDCTEEGEGCGNIGGGQMGCLLPPSHCILRCDDGQTCPESMSCSPTAGICQYVL
ncbi:MAG: hypothetical protein AAF799_28515 [Myxococcota bacterium]